VDLKALDVNVIYAQTLTVFFEKNPAAVLPLWDFLLCRMFRSDD
jgi:hypothetical protein